MRLILWDPLIPKRRNFDPLALCRPIFELRCGMSSLAQKLVDKIRPDSVACFVPPYLADVYAAQSAWPVNDVSTLVGDDLMIVNARAKAASFDVTPVGSSEGLFDDDGDCLYARITREDVSRLEHASLEALWNAAQNSLPAASGKVDTWNYTWELVLANAEQLTTDFSAAGRHGIEGTIEQPVTIRGAAADVYVARDAIVHPMAVIDTERGPVYIDEGAQIYPFTRVEGPCYIGKNSILLAAQCRGGNSIGPECRVGGEIENTIIQGFANKYHDGFLGHAYLGQWVNLGAMTTNSDLKNDYSNVSVVLEGNRSIDTGSRKFGALVGDHTKTAVGTLFNTGAYVGAMGVIAGTGRPVPKFLPSFAWFTDGAVTEGRDRQRLYNAAQVAMSRRGCEWTSAEESMWEEIHQITAPARDEALRRAARAR